jgi:cytochrome P450
VITSGNLLTARTLRIRMRCTSGLREEDPVHFSQTGEWIITRYEDTRNILRSNDFLVGNRFEWLKKGIGYFKYKDLDFSNIEAAMTGFILFLNPPNHTRIRKFIHQVWNSREVEAIIQKNLETLLPPRALIHLI